MKRLISPSSFRQASTSMGQPAVEDDPSKLPTPALNNTIAVAPKLNFQGPR